MKGDTADQGQIKFRDFLRQDREIIQTFLSDLNLQHLLLAYPDEKGRHDVDRWIRRRSDNRDFVFHVVTNDSATFCGFVQIANIHNRGRFGWLGMAIMPQWRGQGYGKQSLQMLLEEADKSLHLRKILLEVRADNLPAIKLYRSLGFRDVGCLQSHYDDGELLHDVLIMERNLRSCERSEP